jgi:hypothetical protein
MCFSFNAAATVTAVQKPETYAMLLPGNYLMGATVKRRKNRQA